MNTNAEVVRTSDLRPGIMARFPINPPDAPPVTTSGLGTPMVRDIPATREPAVKSSDLPTRKEREESLATIQNAPQASEDTAGGEIVEVSIQTQPESVEAPTEKRGPGRPPKSKE